MVYLSAYLGEPTDDRSKCWFCRSARTNSTAISFKAWNQLVGMYQKSRVDTDPIVLAMEMARHFEYEIRRPANKFRSRDQSEVPEQRPIDIYWHFRKHLKESSNRLLQRIEELQEIGDSLYETCLYKPVRDVRGRVVLVPRKKYIEPYLKIVTAERLLRKERPERMFLYANDYSLDASAFNGFANKQRPYYLDNMPSYVLGSKDAKR